MSTKRQNQKEKLKIMPTIQEHNDLGENQKYYQNDYQRDTNEYQNQEKEINLDQFEQHYAQISNNNIIDNNNPQKLIDFNHQQDCKKMQKQNVQIKQTNDIQQLQEIPNPNQLDRKNQQKQSKEIKPQSTLNEEIKIFEERIVKYTSEVNQEIKLSPKLSEEWKKKFTFIKKKK
ncbi:unnamed protein product [Paramecium pentaurelia]|uniref:Uncharacterized protein n=1 Tax=Paramecium pentaurelia TaxID=43138 RepID=A0A8S1WTR8_9CILI|nr:unnamed protein product [Paramecium pentaurelia]